MSKPNKIADWAEKNGFKYRAETDGFNTEGVRELDSFRSWESASGLVVGDYRTRPFEMLEFTTYHVRKHGSSYTDQTALLLPSVAAAIPDFEIVPRDGFGRGFEVLGIGGLKLAKDDAHRMTREIVEAFSKHYMIFAGGILETAADSMDKPGARELDLSAMATICKPNVLRFLARHPGWFIECQGAHLVLWSPKRVLSDDERNELLNTATELLTLLEQADRERSVPGIALENTMDLNPKKLRRLLIGGVAGFFLGGLTAVPLAIFVNPKLIITIPILSMAGLAAGVFIALKTRGSDANLGK